MRREKYCCHGYVSYVFNSPISFTDCSGPRAASLLLLIHVLYCYRYILNIYYYRTLLNICFIYTPPHNTGTDICSDKCYVSARAEVTTLKLARYIYTFIHLYIVLEDVQNCQVAR